MQCRNYPGKHRSADERNGICFVAARARMAGLRATMLSRCLRKAKAWLKPSSQRKLDLNAGIIV